MSTKSYTVELRCDYFAVKYSIIAGLENMCLSYEYLSDTNPNCPNLIYFTKNTFGSFQVSNNKDFQAEIHVNHTQFEHYSVNVYVLTPDPKNITEKLIYYFMKAYSVYYAKTTPTYNFQRYHEYQQAQHNEYLNYIQSTLETYKPYVTGSDQFWKDLVSKNITTATSTATATV